MNDPEHFTPYAYEEHDGLPPDGEPGFFVGYDATRWPFILRWDDEARCWVGTGHDPNMRRSIKTFIARDEMADFIVCHARLPWCTGFRR